MDKLEGLKIYENMDIGNCRINPDALDKINGHPKNAIVIDREYDYNESIMEAMRVPYELLGITYPDELDFCIVIREEL